jgi:hypothetical protein
MDLSPAVAGNFVSNCWRKARGINVFFRREEMRHYEILIHAENFILPI